MIKKLSLSEYQKVKFDITGIKRRKISLFIEWVGFRISTDLISRTIDDIVHRKTKQYIDEKKIKNK